MERIDTGEGFSVLDGAALVMGSAIASIHTLRVMRSDLTGAGWIMIWITFTWVAVTATGPFLYLARRFARRMADYPKIGDRLWALLGIPWLATAAVQSIRTAKERLGGKATDEQRVDNCKVPLDLRGSTPRPDDCGDAASTAPRRR